MPEKKKLIAKEVILNDITSKILRLYNESLEKYGFKLEEDEKGPQAAAAPGKTQTVEGFFIRPVMWLEQFTGSLYGSQKTTLPTLKIELNFIENKLLTKYYQFLTELLSYEEIDMAEIEKKQISSKYILVAELLHRLIAIALSEDKQVSREKLLKVIESFIQKLRTEELLLDSGLNSKFLNKLVTEHPSWKQNMATIISTTGMLCHNREVCSKILNYFKKAMWVINLQLIMFLDNSHNEVGLQDGIAETLIACQNKLLSKEKLPQRHQEVLSDRQAILTILKGKEYPEAWLKRVKQLYGLLNYTENIYELMGKLDLFLEHSGWIVVLAGMIDPNKLSELIRDYQNRFKEILNLGSEELKKILETNMGKIWVASPKINIGVFEGSMSQVHEDLKLLDDEALQQQICQHLINLSQDLIVMQKQFLNSEQQFIYIPRINHILGIQQSSTGTSGQVEYGNSGVRPPSPIIRQARLASQQQSQPAPSPSSPRPTQAAPSPSSPRPTQDAPSPSSPTQPAPSPSSPTQDAPSPTSSRFTQPEPRPINSDALRNFLGYVVSGNQDEAEALLRKDRSIACGSADVRDPANRTFVNITGFQYAVWALDWHMWSMIRKYMSVEDIKQQITGFSDGQWVAMHGKHVNWADLIEKFNQLMIHWYEWAKFFNMSRVNDYWIREIGGAQRLLPMHVLQEYCRSDRPFAPLAVRKDLAVLSSELPDFLENSLPRDDIVNVAELGCRAGLRRSYKARAWLDRGQSLFRYFELQDDKWSDRYDRAALAKLLQVRLEQRKALINEFKEQKKMKTPAP